MYYVHCIAKCIDTAHIVVTEQHFALSCKERTGIPKPQYVVEPQWDQIAKIRQKSRWKIRENWLIVIIQRTHLYLQHFDKFWISAYEGSSNDNGNYGNLHTHSVLEQI